MRKRLAILSAGLLLLAACGEQGTGTASPPPGGESPQATGAVGDPIRIGISLPLTGDFSEPGQGTRRGNELWVKMVNESGGLLGRPVELIVRDDGSDPDTANSDYENLITVEEVDLVFGTFSSRLVIPTSEVAERHDMLYVEGGGGAPEVFNRGLQYIFHAAPTTVDNQYIALAEWILALPEGDRPQTAAYAILDDPFAIAGADGLMELLEEGGIETVMRDVYPPDQTEFLATAAVIADSDADIVVGGTQFEDAVGLVRAMQELSYQPELVTMTTGPTIIEFHEALGTAVNGVMAPVGWSRTADFPTNAEFVEAFEAEYDLEATEDPAQGYAVGQVVGAAVEAVGCAEATPECQGQLRDWLRENTVDTVMGPFSWDERGVGQGAYVMLQWQDEAIEIVLPEGPAQSSEIIFPKPGW
ncbi:MAG: amino acid ABC transporter substrate-binding protein [Candidatus Limnocylindria bacterium]